MGRNTLKPPFLMYGINPDGSILKWHRGRNFSVGDSLGNTEANSFVMFVTKAALLLFRQCVFGGIFRQTFDLFILTMVQILSHRLHLHLAWIWPSLHFLFQMTINCNPHWGSILQVSFLLESPPTYLSTIFPLSPTSPSEADWRDRWRASVDVAGCSWPLHSCASLWQDAPGLSTARPAH